jgi:SAM-dependent methyltransferase
MTYVAGRQPVLTGLRILRRLNPLDAWRRDGVAGLRPRAQGDAMVERPGWVPEGVDVTVPNAARVYDFALGGHHNFGVDREFFAQAQAMMPGARLVAQANRAFLGRAVRRLADIGIRQFLDIGSGIPTLGNVHEVAQEVDPAARVVYVDIDPVAVEQSKAMLAGNPNAGVIQGDLRRPEEILYHPTALELLDFSQPVAVLLIAVLHFIPDSDDPAGIITRLSDALVSGSYVAVSHGAPDQSPRGREAQEAARKLYERTPTPVQLRTAEQVAELLSGLELVEPGVVPATSWYPDPDADDPPQSVALAALARKP